MGKKSADFRIAFIQKLIRELKAIPVQPRKLLVAVSGGADSVALLHALNEVKDLFHLELVVAHVHHGRAEDAKLNEFRDKAKKFVHDLALQNGIPFVTNPVEEVTLSSEADLRRYRYGFLTSWQKELQCDAIALGHHFEDLLETQVMRLIRGSARLGLAAMSVLSPQGRLRPFLNIRKDEIRQYLQRGTWTWVEDPSNLWEKPLRNQVRQWLDDIEKKLPGAKENFAKSLQRLVRFNQEMKYPWKEKALTKSGIRRSVYLSLAEPYKTELLAHYIREKGQENYTSGQINELMKRLDVPYKEHRFKFLGHDWVLEPEMIQIAGVFESANRT